MMSERVREIELDLFARQNEAIRLLTEANYDLISILKQHEAISGEETALLKMKAAEEILSGE